MLEEMVRKTEHRLEDYKTELVARAEFAETRVAQITGLRDESESSMITVSATESFRGSQGQARAKLGGQRSRETRRGGATSGSRNESIPDDERT